MNMRLLIIFAVAMFSADVQAMGAMTIGGNYSDNSWVIDQIDIDEDCVLHYVRYLFLKGAYPYNFQEMSLDLANVAPCETASPDATLELDDNAANSQIVPFVFSVATLAAVVPLDPAYQEYVGKRRGTWQQTTQVPAKRSTKAARGNCSLRKQGGLKQPGKGRGN